MMGALRSLASGVGLSGGFRARPAGFLSVPACVRVVEFITVTGLAAGPGLRPGSSFPLQLMKLSSLSLAVPAIAALMAIPVSTGWASIVEVQETGLNGDRPAVIASNYDEDTEIYCDRIHQNNGPCFNAGNHKLSTSGTEIVGLPPYLIGNDYVKFANDVRENAGYSALISTDTPSVFYLMIDNRLNGPAGNASNNRANDPVLGGTLQWVIDGGWIRVNTGISPNGQADYVGADEGAGAIGPGQSIENFYSVYKSPAATTSVVVKNNGLNSGNMISVVAVPTEAPPEAIVSYTAAALSVPPGGSTSLSWLIASNATEATLSPEVGNILPLTDALGAGRVTVSPVVNTTYTLSVTTPGSNTPTTRSLTVAVLPLSSFSVNRQRIDPGESVVLKWTVRPGAAVSIDGIGDLTAQTSPEGQGSVTVQPESTRNYIIRATAENLTTSATTGVYVRSLGTPFALIDIGGTAGRPEPGSVSGREVGAASAGTDNVDLPETLLLSDTGEAFTLTMDTLGPDGIPQGALDWRDRGDAADMALNRLAEDFVKNSGGYIRAVFGSLPAGTYDVVSYHLDPQGSQSERIKVFVTDASGTRVDTGVTGAASFPGHPSNTNAPQIAGLTTELNEAHTAKFRITANGTDEVMVYFECPADNIDWELPLNALRLTKAVAPPQDDTWALIDLGSINSQPEPGAAGNAVIGPSQPGAEGMNLDPVSLTSRNGIPFRIALDNLGPDGMPVGALDWRDAGDCPDAPLSWLVKDFVRNTQGMIRARLIGLPAGQWKIQAYLMDPTQSLADTVRVLVTDATGTAVDTQITGTAAFASAAPGLTGLWPGVIGEHTVTIPVISNGTDEVVIYFDGTLSGHIETPLAGLRILPAVAPGTSGPIEITSFTRTSTEAAAQVVITFVSETGRTYSVFASDDPAIWGAALTTTLAATGTATTWTESGIPLTAGRRFYQIRRNN